MSNLLDELRNDMIEASEESKGQSDDLNNGVKFKLGFNTYIVRLLPPARMKEKKCFYATHSYNFINDEQFFSLKKFDGKINPIDNHVKKMFEQVKATGDKELEKKASAIKRKRNYYFEVLLLGINDEMFDEPIYKVMIDTTNRGLLAKKLCAIMGVPFFKDIEDKWVDKESKKIDTDKEYINLLDIKSGYDVKIKKTKWGDKNWEIDFDVIPLTKKGPRSLTKREVEIIKENRVDIFSIEEYVNDIQVVNEVLKKWLENQIQKEDIVESNNYDLNDLSFDNEPKTPKIVEKTNKEEKKNAGAVPIKQEAKTEKNKKQEEKDTGFDIEDDEEFEKMLEEIESSENVADDDDLDLD